ncbi:Crp/Fnr family transcriptional regulator, partial [Psychroflexus sp. MES1-P1E]|uniref:Crp/Fnr family transcriptional regulator n=1 Tax=Psychroflexus sp. MES1-P1E TaxID=2058320 RepID=UPI000CC21135
MYKELEQYIRSHGKIGQKELQEITQCFTPIETSRNEMLCNIGQVCKHFYFIKKGCIRLYEIDNKGTEVTGYFALEDTIMSANTSFILQKPSRDCLVSLEP